MSCQRVFRSYAFALAFVLIAGAAGFLAAPSPAWAVDPPAEVCDGIDNDGDGDTDETFNVGDDCSITSTNAFGTCLTPGSLACAEDGSDTECVANAGAVCVVASAAVVLGPPPSAEGADPPPEVCDGVDNDGDGEIDEGFDVGDDCSISSTNAFGTCETAGTKQCTADTLGTECVLGDGVTLDLAEPEMQAAGDSSCFDDIDNDCDGFIDVDGGIIDAMPVGPDPECVEATEQFCNGFDDDNDGMIDEDFGVGGACMVGVGQCERSGSFVCDAADPAEQATVCSVGPGNPIAENTPGAFRCVDGLDNDCDGLVDIADPDCQTAEVCDGADNDGDGVADEDFGDLGDSCTVGVGACAVDGIRVCNAPGDATQCNVVAALPGVEGPAGATCSDGIDNDCDGDVDGDDLSCDSAGITVSCSLVSLKKGPNGPKMGKPDSNKKNPPGTSCEEKFRLDIESNVAPEFLTAEIMGLNPDGSLIDLSPATLPVQDGDELHLNSRIDPDDWKVDAKGRFIDVFAPVPLVRVTADTGQNRVEAFCSHIPWLNVDQPSGEDQVVTASEGDLVPVVVPIPRVDPTTIGIVVDGVDILDAAHLNIDSTTAFPNPGAPIGGTIDINGQMVVVADLVVDTSDLAVPGRNALTMTLENLGGGGHIVVVNGDPRADALPTQTSSQCHLDDVLDAGTVSVFGIIINEPAANASVPAGNTTVSARISHGRDIAGAQVQGVAATLGPQTCSPLTFDAFGETFSVDTCTRDINESLPQTNQSMALQLGTIDIGQNILTIAAQDDLVNRTFARQRFTSGIGSTTAPGVSALSPGARAAIEKGLELELRGAFAGNPEALQPVDIQVTADAVNFNLAFTFGASEAGLNGFFGSVCTDALAAVEDAIDTALKGTPIPSVHIDLGFPLCDLDLGISTPPDQIIDFGPLNCSLDAKMDFLTVEVILTEVKFNIRVADTCKRKALGVCISKIKVDFETEVSLQDAGVMFDFSEDLVLNGGSTDFTDVFDPGILIADTNVDADIGCVAGFFLDVFNAITGGLLDIEGSVSQTIEDALTFTVDLKEALRASNPDPLEVQKIEVNENPVQADGLEIGQEILSVQITGQPGLDDGTGSDGIKDGLTGTIGANFTVPLPEEEDIEGVVFQTPPSPDYPLNAKEIFFAPSDDIFNLLFAAIGLQGAFTTSCVDTALTLEDTLPADCTTLVGADQTQTDIMIGRCHGAKGIDCTTLANLGQQFFCNLTQIDLANANISKDTGLLFCANQPLAPRTLIRDLAPTPDLVEAELKANDLKVTIALDRNADDQFDPDQDFGFAPGCLGLDFDNTKDCKWSDACFDLKLATEFTLGMSTPGSSQIVRTVTGVSDSMGFECAGLFDLGSGPALLTEAGASGPVSTIQDNIQNLVRVFEALGLDLGGLVGLQNPSVIAIDVPGYSDDDCADCAEYVGVTGDIVP